ncbi:hypothetical protein GCM10023215_55030 [Pseudonocardia yuanmonensis]|uniref:Serine protease n=1 Tax=Pseudonocardia yuanmonensis TaxID=1095914 RepID=A0ABP8XFQ0_9PSEU
MNRAEQEAAAAERYRSTTRQRKDNRKAREAAHTAVADSPAQLEARARRLVRKGEVDVDALVRAVTGPDKGTVLERIIGAANELQGVNFLARGAEAARTVARVSIRSGRDVVGFGTAFLVGRRLALTNNHVLPDARTAAGSFLEFDLEAGVDGLPKPVVRFELDPGTLFATDEHLDYTLVAVRPDASGRVAGEVFGWNTLAATQGKIVTGEPVNVVGHPDGRPKEIAVRANELVNQLSDFLHYNSDTLPGSSGSPVYNDQWEVVALHHAGVPDPAGGPDAWIANEGARISRVLAHLSGLDLDAAQRRVVAELGAQAQPEAGARPAVAAARPAGPEDVAALPRIAAGLPGRPSASGRRLVYLHGRGQGGRDPAALRADWTGGLARGLAAGGMAPVDAADACVPFYGDVLDGLVDGAREAVPFVGTTAEQLAPPSGPAREAYGALLRETAERTGMPAGEQEGAFVGGLVAALQGPLSWIAGRSGLDDLVIATVFRDVALYLEDDIVRRAVLDTVRADLPPDGEIVLVAHSLGAVVALDLLRELPAGRTVPLLVTAGSPLGLDAVQKRLLAGGPERPRNVGTWVNAWAAADAVAIGCPLADDWADVRDLRTDNPKDRPHDIREYLADPRVATAVGGLLR